MITIRQYAEVNPSAYHQFTDQQAHPNIYIGTGAYIGPGVKFICKDIHIGDYTKIHDNTLICGEKDFRIGHNCWVGGGCILDTRGGLTIGNGVGIGAGSQLWSHIRFGDMLQGCMWNKENKLIIEDDVWFVGHCLVSPGLIAKKSMAMLGSVITGDMVENTIYGGVPARRISMNQFDAMWTAQDCLKAQEKMFEKYWVERKYNEPDRNDFNPVRRTYIKRNTLEQHQFMKWAVPLYKYNPIEEGYDK